MGWEYFGNQCGFEIGLCYLQGSMYVCVFVVNDDCVKGDGMNGYGLCVFLDYQQILQQVNKQQQCDGYLYYQMNIGGCFVEGQVGQIVGGYVLQVDLGMSGYGE